MKLKKLTAIMLSGLLLLSCSSGDASDTTAESTTAVLTDAPATDDGNKSSTSPIVQEDDPISALIGTIGDGNGLLWYEFEEKAGSAKLLSSLSQPRDSIEARATLLPEEGVEGGAISFDGKDDRIKLNNDFNNVSQITAGTFLHPSFTTLSVAFYFMPETLSSDQLLYEQGDEHAGLAIGIVGGKLTAAIGVGRSATATGKAKTVGEYTLNDDDLHQWIHVAVTFDGNENGGTARLFVNGETIVERSTLGAVIPQTLDAAGLGAAYYGTNALGLSGAYFAGKMDDLRIYSTAIQPMGDLEENVVYLQSAAAKNAYLKGSFASLTCDYSVEPALRGWIITDGLSGSGVSLRLTGTNKYIVAQDGKLSVQTISTDEDKSSATFTAEEPLAVPSWGASTRSDFVSFKSAEGTYIAAVDGKVSLMSADTSPLSATFKQTGDQTAVIDGLKGAVYYPSYALNAPQFWKWYDHDIIDRDMGYAERLGINAFRIWISFEYWLEDPDHFEAGFKDFLELADAHGIKIMVSLFEGCGDSYEYESVHTWSRVYTGDSCGWAITSPAAAIYNNRSRWEEPKEFVTWFIGLFGSDERLMSIELYNEPWGTNRAALAKYLCEYAVTIQGSVPLIAGTAPADAFNIKDTVKLGMDQLQYHDNFPGSAAAFKSNANGKIEQARLANLPIYCTEVQWVGGPSGINYPVYSNLAPTCNELMESGKWAPFYWTLMVHPCYLNSYRNNFKMYNGLVNENGTVNSLANAEAWAGQTLDVMEETVNPYDRGYYLYEVTYSDSFFDKNAYKWSVVNGNWSAASEAYAGNGLTIANNTHFANLTATFDVKLTDGNAGFVLRMTDENNYVLARLSVEKRVLEIVEVKNGKSKVMATSSTVELDAAALQSVTVEASGKTVTITCNCITVSAGTDLAVGKFGFAADGEATFDNLHVDAK
ncbi:MAG: LamG domain-containing protein [Clostridia bacterium]|nr:LamG domain-containing protein [Clostridia bacterium]